MASPLQKEPNNDVISSPAAIKDQGSASNQKAVTIFDEPEHIEPPEYESASTSPKLHRASISGKKMTGRPSIQPTLSSASLIKVPSYFALDEAAPPDHSPGGNTPSSGTGDARALLLQVNNWLNEEKNKRSSKSRSANHSASDSPVSTRSEVDLDLEKLERILAGFSTSNAAGSLNPSRKNSIASLRRGSLLKKSHRSTQPGVSSDTEWNDGDILVPHVEATLDNSKTMAYSGGEADAESDDTAKQNDQKCWDQFKQEIVRLTHTLKIRGWRRIPIEQGSTIHVERLSGALTNAVYVVKPPKVLPPVPAKTDGSKSYTSTSKPLELILRIYGPQVEHLIDREDELMILRRLARKKIGPRLLGYFTNGRFEEFLHAKTLAAEDLRVPETSKQIAKRMRELHDGIELLPSERQAGPRAISSFSKWLERCETVITWLDQQVKLDQENKQPASRRYTRRGHVCGVEWPLFRRTYEKYYELLLKKHGGEGGIRSRLAFAHNDTQYGNLMRLDPPGDSPLLQPANQHRQLVVIDFEYAGANPPGYEFANHFTEWCYNYHHPEKPYACNTNYYPTAAEQYRFMRSYVMHRPQFAPAASATPKMEGREKTNISDFMLDARSPGTPNTDYDAEEKAREERMEGEIRDLLQETQLWRIANSAFWIAWGIVQAKVPELDEPKKSKVSKIIDQIKERVSAKSDPLDDDVKAIQEASKHDRPEGRANEDAHAEGNPLQDEEEEEDFDYLAYAQERSMFFWGDCLQLGIVKEADLPDSLLKQIKLVKFAW